MKKKAPPVDKKCPNCDMKLKKSGIDYKNIKEYDDGSKTGDLICGNCGYTIEENVLMSEPDYI